MNTHLPIFDALFDNQIEYAVHQQYCRVRLSLSGIGWLAAVPLAQDIGKGGSQALFQNGETKA